MHGIRIITAGGVATVAVTGAFALGGGFGDDDGPAAAPAAPATRLVAQDGGSGGGSLTDLYASVKDGVAFVQSQTGSGSGFVLDADGHIVTNEHVVEGSSAFAVRLGEDGELVPATLVGADASTDLAVLKVDPAAAGALHPLALGDAGDVQIGQSVIAIGSPFGLEGTLTSGIVSALGRDIESPSGATISGAIQTDTAINPGNSGGPLLDASGDVIGVNAQIASSSGGNTGVGFAISVDTVKQVVPQLIAGGGDGAGSSPYGYGYEQQAPYGYEESAPYGYEEPSPYGYDESSPYAAGGQAPAVVLIPVP